MTRAADPHPAQLPLAGGHAGATVAVHPLLTAEMLTPTALFDRPRNALGLLGVLTGRAPRVWIPIPAFLVHHPGAGAILIDTGLHPSVARRPVENLGPITGRLAPIRMDATQAVSQRLAAHQLGPHDIAHVIMTHLHYDHASGVSEFPQATFVLDGREWRAAVHGGLRDGYRHSHFDRVADWRTIDFEAFAVDSFATFGRAVDLFGDGSVRLLSTPGHTLGHMSVLMRLADGEMLITADAMYTRASLDADLYPLVCADRHLYRRSLQEIRDYVAQTPGAIVVPGHDPVAWSELAEVYV